MQKDVLWPCFVAADAGRRGPTPPTISRINAICPLITRRFGPQCAACTLSLPFVASGPFVTSITYISLHEKPELEAASLPPRPLNAKWFISKLSMSTAAAGDLPSRPPRPCRGESDVSELPTGRARCSLKPQSALCLLAGTSRSYLPLDFLSPKPILTSWKWLLDCVSRTVNTQDLEIGWMNWQWWDMQDIPNPKPKKNKKVSTDGDKLQAAFSL